MMEEPQARGSVQKHGISMTALEYVQHWFPLYVYEINQAQQGFVACIWFTTLHVEVCYHEKHRNLSNFPYLFNRNFLSTESQLTSKCVSAAEGPEQNPFSFTDNKSPVDGWVELVDSMTARWSLDLDGMPCSHSSDQQARKDDGVSGTKSRPITTFDGEALTHETLSRKM